MKICQEISTYIIGFAYLCDLEKGHIGPHHDSRFGADWEQQ
jgi:hypothetical protein